MNTMDHTYYIGIQLFGKISINRRADNIERDSEFKLPVKFTF